MKDLKQKSLFYLDRLLLNNFRNYHELQVNFHPRLNIITGKNGQGKTNLIEAVYYLAVTRSFRTNRDRELAGFNGQHFMIKGQFVKDDFTPLIQVSYDCMELEVVVDKQKKGRFDQLQQFPIVAFSPDDLLLIKEGPAIRRRYINLESSRLNQHYFMEMRAYHRVLLQRNRLLKEKKGRLEIEKLLEPWNDSLINHGSRIIRCRKEQVSKLATEAAPFFSAMTGGQEELALEYKCSIDCKVDFSDLEQQFRETLRLKKDLEIKKQATVAGPHLDDIMILINGRDSRKYSSQGQKRAAALALKMAEAILLYKNNGRWPILLLDDVFSEFDRHRKEQLLLFLSGIESQCFLTSAVELEHLPEAMTRGSKYIYIHRGLIRDEKDGSGC